MKRCNSCSMIMGDAAEVCASCGHKLKGNFTYICNCCGQVNYNASGQCPKCGTKNPTINTGVQMTAKALTGSAAKLSGKLENISLEEYKEKITLAVNTAKEKVKAIPADKYKEKLTSAMDDIKNKSASIPVKEYQEQATEAANKIVEKLVVSKKYISKQGMAALTCGLILGMISGYVYGNFFSGVGAESFKPFDTKSLTSNVKLAVVKKAKPIARIMYPDIDVYDRASDLSGVVIAKLDKGVEVEYLGLLPGLDKDKNIGIVRHDLKIERIFSRSYIVLAGTQARIERYDSSTGEYDAIVNIDGKQRSITLTSDEVKMPYKRGWVKIRLNDGREGYVYGEVISASELK